MTDSLQDYSHYVLEGQSLLRQISEHAARREYQTALNKATDLGTCIIRLFRAIRATEGQYYDKEQAIQAARIESETSGDQGLS